MGYYAIYKTHKPMHLGEKKHNTGGFKPIMPCIFQKKKQVEKPPCILGGIWRDHSWSVGKDPGHPRLRAKEVPPIRLQR